MTKDTRTIPVPVAKLIMGELKNTIDRKSKKRLDKWVNASDENMKIFEECVEVWFGPMLDKEVIEEMEPDEIFQLWDIAGLMVRYMKRDITTTEKQALDNWVSQSSLNRNLFGSMRHEPNLKSVMLILLEKAQFFERSELV